MNAPPPYSQQYQTNPLPYPQQYQTNPSLYPQQHQPQQYQPQQPQLQHNQPHQSPPGKIVISNTNNAGNTSNLNKQKRLLSMTNPIHACILTSLVAIAVQSGIYYMMIYSEKLAILIFGAGFGCSFVMALLMIGGWSFKFRYYEYTGLAYILVQMMIYSEKLAILIFGAGFGCSFVMALLMIGGWSFKFRYYEYTGLAYILVQTLLIMIVSARLCYYTTIFTVFKMFKYTFKDPLGLLMIQKVYHKNGTAKLQTNIIICCSLAVVWMYAVRTSYNIYRRERMLLRKELLKMIGQANNNNNQINQRVIL
uniref:DUF4203 domain-containing protein n=1 Tax=Rhabditophanes sp. KR3021 TaxID=114890 RepID=A0AC35TW00_9BILA